MRSSPLAALLVSAVVALAAGCTAGGPPAAPVSSAPDSSHPARTGCGSPVETGPLPEWARAGFSGESNMPHVVGDHGDIVGAIFGHPLTVDRPQGPTNKILWVARVSDQPGDLVIEAALDGSETSVTRRVAGGPGPSIVDLPEPGCWHLTLSWSGRTDTVDLTYR